VISARSLAGCALVALCIAAVAGCAPAEKKAAAPPTLDEVLTLVKEKGGSHTTVQARVVLWTDPEVHQGDLRSLTQEVEFRGNGGAAIMLSLPGGAIASPSSRVWLERAGRCRSESDSIILVVDGAQAWTALSGSPSVMVSPASESSQGCGADFLLDPPALFKELEMSVEGVHRVDGREAIVLRGTPDPDAPLGSAAAGLGIGATSHRVVVDRDTGLPLEVTSYLAEKPFSRVTVERLAVDEDIPDATFTYTPAPGARVLDEKALQGEELPIADAAARASFQLWAPAGFSGLAWVSPDLMTDTNRVHFTLGDESSAVSVDQQKGSTLGGGGERITRDGVDMDLFDEPASAGFPGTVTITMIRGRTEITLAGGGSVDDMVALARSFQPVPKP
jgi:outer membrane lipoprotein-sorting protein